MKVFPVCGVGPTVKIRLAPVLVYLSGLTVADNLPLVWVRGGDRIRRMGKKMAPLASQLEPKTKSDADVAQSQTVEVR